MAKIIMTGGEELVRGWQRGRRRRERRKILKRGEEARVLSYKGSENDE